ncbi:hypothetical protein [Kribbella sp. NPDC006257]|uniref:hypothetical protein n=1 Tax=Kribbella sp. NPDC006257 TaxID=3156738 RepID=UPI0033BA61C9
MTSIDRRSLLKAGMATAVASGFTWTTAQPGAAATGAGLLDVLEFGVPGSERAHAVAAELSDVIRGGLGQAARVLNPRDPADWWGGTVRFTVAVAATGTTYASVKLFGSEFADADHEWRLQFFIDGKVLGWFDQSVLDQADQMSQHPRLADRFFLHTLPLPEFVTQGRRAVELEIRAMGRIYAYGNQDSFYRPMTTPSRGLYRVYTHTTPYFEPPNGDNFGQAAPPATRQNTDNEMIARIRKRVLDDQNALLYAVNPASLDAWGYTTLAEGYRWPGSPAYRNPLTLSKVCQAIDGRYLAWKADSKVMTDSDQQWQGFGRVGLALMTLWDDLQPELDKFVTPGGTDVMNPGFEVGSDRPAGWNPAGWANKGTFSRDTTVAHGGAASLKISANAGGSMLITPSSRTKVGPGQLTFSCWVKAAPAVASAHVNLLFWNAQNAFIGGDHNVYRPTGSGEWQTVGATIDVPDGAVEFEFWMATANGDTAWFDDIEVGAPPPVQADPVPRRTAYREMLLASREYWRQHQRHYTNQAQITSIGIYQANRGLRLLSPADAWPESTARSWLYESVGLEPWRGPEREDGSKTWTLGHDYHVVSSAGLTRELGYVGTYGEVTDWLIAMYESVTGGPDATDDERLRDQLLKIIHTRGWFRHPAEDEDGKRAMRLEQMIGWRNEHYPGDMVYAQRTAWDGHPLEAAAVLQDRRIVGWAQQMVADGQLAPQLDLLVSNTGRRVGLNAFHFIARDLPVFQNLPASPERLPGGWDRPDFVFTDEEAGAVAIKRGAEIFYASLYWRAKQAVNDYARVHLVTPQSERSGTIRERSVFDKDPANTYTVQDWVCWDFAINDSGSASTVPAGGWRYPGPTLHQVYAGQRLYLAPVPDDMDPALGGTTVGIEKIEVGRAPFYVLEYAGYQVAMNTSKDRTFSWRPSGTGLGKDLRTGQDVPLRRSIDVPPRTTVVLFTGR